METRLMTMTEVKDKHLGRGLRRLRYEKRFERCKNKIPFDVGQKMGLTIDDTIMFQEYLEHQIDTMFRNLFISAN